MTRLSIAICFIECFYIALKHSDQLRIVDVIHIDIEREGDIPVFHQLDGTLYHTVGEIVVESCLDGDVEKLERRYDFDPIVVVILFDPHQCFIFGHLHITVDNRLKIGDYTLLFECILNLSAPVERFLEIDAVVILFVILQMLFPALFGMLHGVIRFAEWIVHTACRAYRSTDCDVLIDTGDV
ncbi:hypothetical protein D1872_251550 [compost metagenome]